MESIKIKKHSHIGVFWFFGWLFTMGIAHLSFWQGIAAIVTWPYYIGTAVAVLIHPGI